MKYNSILKLVLFAFICAFMATSCVKEGPLGPEGADGTDGTNGSDGRPGVDGKVSCMVCHSGTNMERITAEFVMSAHNVGAIAVDNAGGRKACARCHSHEGFTQFSVFNSVLGDITNPSAWKCGTCHGLHKSFEETDYDALRMIAPVTLVADGSVIDFKGNSNLCATCHQTRRTEPNKPTPAATYRITSTYYEPHYYASQGNILAGVGFAEIPGLFAYPAAGTDKHFTEASCTGCHMAPFSKGQGGHSFKANLDACNSCHGATNTDFNYGGVQTEVKQLLDKLKVKLLALGIIAGDEVLGYHPVVGTYPMIQAQAYFNWDGVNDRSLGAHNPKYVKALLLNSIAALP